MAKRAGPKSDESRVFVDDEGSAKTQGDKLRRPPQSSCEGRGGRWNYRAVHISAVGTGPRGNGEHAGNERLENGITVVTGERRMPAGVLVGVGVVGYEGYEGDLRDGESRQGSDIANSEGTAE